LEEGRRIEESGLGWSTYQSLNIECQALKPAYLCVANLRLSENGALRLADDIRMHCVVSNRGTELQAPPAAIERSRQER
jgi:hypothetical protein